MVKCCKHCNERKEETEFPKYKLKHDKVGRIGVCKKCYYERAKKYIYRWRKKHPEQQNAILKRYRNTSQHNKEYYRKRSLQLLYGMTLEQYNKIFDKQNGCCSICGKHQSECNKALSVDHNHSSNQVRGLLCNYCNRGIGIFNENIQSLNSAIEYLKKWNN